MTLLWKEVDRIRERSTFRALAWLTERVRNDENFIDWQEASLPEHFDRCERCAPTTPAIMWTRNQKNRIVAVEDTLGAGKYERDLKRRPAPFVTQLKVEGGRMGHVRIGINIASLMHRALARLPVGDGKETATISWRLDADYAPMAKLYLPKFTLRSNKADAEHEQPPSFVSTGYRHFGAPIWICPAGYLYM